MASVGLPIPLRVSLGRLAHRVDSRLGAATQAKLGEDARYVVLSFTTTAQQIIGGIGPHPGDDLSLKVGAAGSRTGRGR
jgi:hypothetical protein